MVDNRRFNTLLTKALMTVKYVKLPNSLVYPVTIDEVQVSSGQWLKKGDPIYTVVGNGGRLGRVNAPFDGQVASDPVPRHTVFDQPQPVIGIEPGEPPTAPSPDPSGQSGFQSPMFDLWRTDAPSQPVEPAPADTATSSPSPQPQTPPPSPAASQSAASVPPAQRTPRPSSPRLKPASQPKAPPERTAAHTPKAKSAPAVRKGGFVGLMLAVLFLPVLAGAVYLFADGRGLTYGGLPGGVAFGAAAIIAAFVLLLGVPRGPSTRQALVMSVLAGGVVAVLSQSPDLRLPGLSGVFTSRVTVPPEVEAPVAAAVVRNLEALRHPFPFGVRTGFVNDGEIFITMGYQPRREMQRSIHVGDIDRIEAWHWGNVFEPYVSLDLHCKAPGCVTTHRDTGDGDGIFFEPDHLLVRLYYKDNIRRVDSLIDDIARLAALYGNDELKIRKSGNPGLR